MFTGLIQQIDRAKFLLKDHSPTILTGVGVTGTVVTAYLTGRASFKAAALIEQESHEMQAHEDPNDSGQFIGVRVDKDLTRIDKAKLVWKCYIPPVSTGAATIASIIMANKITSKRIAALGIAAGVSERALQEYKDKVMDKLTARQQEKTYEEIAQDRINNSQSREVVLVGQGQVLCYDLTTDRYFQSTIEDIKRAENKINSELLNHMAASLAEFHDELGLRATNYTDSVGWASPEMFQVVFSSVLSPDGRPCVAIDFVRPPVLEYASRY